MKQQVADRIDGFIEIGWKARDENDYLSWIRRVLAFLNVVADKDVVAAIERLGGQAPIHEWQVYRDRQISHLEGLALTLGHLAKNEQVISAVEAAVSQVANIPGNRVFLVHGHNAGAKESVARFLEKLGLEPVILHEQANEGQTIIEKFELHANVDFAVVLFTADDVGSSASVPNELRPRARQNVVLELGYFTGRLGRKKVCALYQPTVEIPSDLHGVLFVELDIPGAWKQKLAQELVSAGIKIDLHGLVN